MSSLITLCLVVKNEELLIGQCLEAAKGFVDEIVVVDTGSTDRTVEIAEKHGARIINYSWDGSLGRARNAYIAAASNPWLLVLDGDERLSKMDFLSLRKLTQSQQHDAYFLKLRNYTNGFDLLEHWQANDGSYPNEESFSQCPGWSAGSILRLFRKFDGLQYDEGTSVHTNPLVSLKKGRKKIGTCDLVIHHFQCRKGGDEFIAQKLAHRLAAEIKHARLYPQDPWIPFNIGASYFHLGEDRKALKYLGRALKLLPKNPKARFMRALVYLQLRRYAAAVKDLTSVLRSNPKNAEAWTVLGIIHDRRDDHAAARKALEKALRHTPRHPLAHNSLGIVYEKLGRIDRAVEHYGQALAIHPSHPEAHFNLGALWENQGCAKKAIACYKKALDINSKDVEAEGRLRHLLQTNGRGAHAN